MLELAIMWVLTVITFILGYGIGRASLTPVEEEGQDNNEVY